MRVYVLWIASASLCFVSAFSRRFSSRRTERIAGSSPSSTFTVFSCSSCRVTKLSQWSSVRE